MCWACPCFLEVAFFTFFLVFLFIYSISFLGLCFCSGVFQEDFLIFLVA